MAYDSIRPFGVERDNIHAGIIASTIANCHSKKSWQASDFMLKDDVQKREKRAQDFLKGLRAHSRPKKRNRLPETR